MLILYVLSVVSFCALVWAAFAIARHVRLTASPAPSRAEAAPLTADSTDSQRQPS